MNKKLIITGAVAGAAVSWAVSRWIDRIEEASWPDASHETLDLVVYGDPVHGKTQACVGGVPVQVFDHEAMTRKLNLATEGMDEAIREGRPFNAEHIHKHVQRGIDFDKEFGNDL